ncbi:Outer membrane protein assembly factor BamA [compost metagenome]
MNRSFQYLLLLVFFGTSCSNTKYLAEGELLYTGAKIKIEGNETSKKEKLELKSELNKLVRPKPNSDILGLRPKLFIYNIAGTPKKEKGIRHWLKTKVGEAPVLYSQVDLEYNKSVLQNFAENNGSFKIQVSVDSVQKGKTVEANYNVSSIKKFKIKTVKFPEDSSEISREVRNTSRRSLLKKGDDYSLDIIKKERVRIDTKLKEKGFFYFNPDYLKIQVDSTVANHEVDLIVKVKNEAPKLSKEQYKINKIIIYPNYSISNDSLVIKPDSVIKHNDFTIIGGENLFKPKIFDRALYFKKDDLYNRTNHNLSLSRLVSLGTFKFVKNQFKVADTIGNYLDAYYYLTPFKKKSISFEILAKTNDANYTGTELNANWSNRNAFKGAELLTVSVFGGFEVQVSGQNEGYNVYRLGTESNLIWPRIIAPFQIKSSSAFVPKTKATLGYEFQNRTQLYTLATFNTAFGYLWKANERKEHHLNLTEITYARPENVTALYEEQMAQNPSLEKVIEKQLVFGPTYSFTYSNTMKKKLTNTFYNKISVDFSANITGLLTGANGKAGDTIKVFGVPFSQFVKIENEFRHFLKLSKESQLASRLIVGAGFAYGNLEEMPYIKQFFIGGTNSIRAFRARSLGPGSYYDPAMQNDSIAEDQSGDLKLEFNTEYRAQLFGKLKGALFIDAGNIWLLSDDPDKPGSKFSKDFMNDIAVGTGVGLRFDLSFLILRTDFAFPIRKPYLPDGERWVIDDINFGSGSWRNENLIFNLAIGYPF